MLRVGKTYSGKLRMPWEAKAQVMALNTVDKREAMRALEKIAQERRLEHNGDLAPASERKAALMRLDELRTAYLADLKVRGRSEGTLAKYLSNLQVAMTGCRWTGLRCVTAESFCSWRSSVKCAPKTLNDVLASCNGFLRWLVRQRMLKANPLEFVGRADMRTVRRFRRALAEDEQKRLIEGAPLFRAVVYLLILETGIRRKELNELKVGDFTFDTPVPFVVLPASITKNRKQATMRLRAHVADAVRAILPDNPMPFEFVFKNRVPRISTFKRDLRVARIPFETEAGRVDLHSLRDTLCTNLMVKGVHPRVAQELMRHSELKLTMKTYTDVSQLPVAAALEKLPVLCVKTDTQKDTQEHTQRKPA